MRHPPTHEEIRVAAPIGAPAWVFEEALRLGRVFATNFTDRPAGLRHGVTYTHGFWQFHVHWTAAHRVVVRAQVGLP